MLSGKTDLTENRMFFDHTKHRVSFGNTIGLTYKGVNMSVRDYDRLVLREKFFGKVHMDESFRIFRFLREKKYRDEIHNCCIRCGKPIRVPWHNHGGLCTSCHNEIGEYKYGRLPWDFKAKAFHGRDDRDILHLR